MFKDFVKEERLKLGLSQRELAKLAGFAHPVISAIESGKNTDPTDKILTGLANAFKINVYVLKEVVKGNDPDTITVSNTSYKPIDYILETYFPGIELTQQEKESLEQYTVESIKAHLKYK